MKEALKLALEVLEDLPGFRADIDNAITAIKAALAQPAQRTWVSLTPEDRLCAKYMLDASEGIEAVIDYITAKLKELNT